MMPEKADMEDALPEGEVWPPPILFQAVPVAKNFDKALLHVCLQKSQSAAYSLMLTGAGVWLGNDQGYFRIVSHHLNKHGLLFSWAFLIVLLFFCWITYDRSYEAVKAWRLLAVPQAASSPQEME